MSCISYAFAKDMRVGIRKSAPHCDGCWRHYNNCKLKCVRYDVHCDGCSSTSSIHGVSRRHSPQERNEKQPCTTPSAAAARPAITIKKTTSSVKCSNWQTHTHDLLRLRRAAVSCVKHTDGYVITNDFQTKTARIKQSATWPSFSKTDFRLRHGTIVY